MAENQETKVPKSTKRTPFILPGRNQIFPVLWLPISQIQVNKFKIYGSLPAIHTFLSLYFAITTVVLSIMLSGCVGSNIN